MLFANVAELSVGFRLPGWASRPDPWNEQQVSTSDDCNAKLVAKQIHVHECNTSFPSAFVTEKSRQH